MLSLRQLCEERTDLTESDISLLEKYETTLPSMAILIRGDIFIDCMDGEGNVFVAAQAFPQRFFTKYTGTVVGAAVTTADEPAVYRTFATGIPHHDTIAHTQENVTVRQNVTPILNDKGSTIAVVIAELDISHEISMEKKLNALDAEWSFNGRSKNLSSSNKISEEHSSFVQEANHRIKNHLQIISSSCGIKSRRAKTEEAKLAYAECSSLAVAVAKLHEIMSPAPAATKLLNLVDVLKSLLQDLAVFLSDRVIIEFNSNEEEILSSHDKVLAVVICVNELVVNAAKHAALDSKSVINIYVERMRSVCAINVSDNCGGIPESAVMGTGWKIISSTIKEKLAGNLSLDSDEQGTSVSFSFLID